MLSNVAALDETVLKCLQRNAPTVFLPRKPHPCGIRVYSLVSEYPGSHRPFCFAMLPDHSSGDKLKVREFYDWVDKVWDVKDRRLTADSFFCDVDWLLDPNNTIRATLAVSSSRERNLVEICGRGLVKGKYRSFWNGEACFQMFYDEATVSVISTEFCLEEEEVPVAVAVQEGVVKMTSEKMVRVFKALAGGDWDIVCTRLGLPEGNGILTFTCCVCQQLIFSGYF